MAVRQVGARPAFKAAERGAVSQITCHDDDKRWTVEWRRASGDHDYFPESVVAWVLDGES